MLKSQYFPHEINLRRLGFLTDEDITGFQKTVKAVRKLFKSGLIDIMIVPGGVLMVKDEKEITIKQFESGVMPGGLKVKGV